MFYIRQDASGAVTNIIAKSVYDGLPQDKKGTLGEVFLVESVPEAPYIEGKATVTRYDKVAKTFSHSYVDRPLTQTEELNKVKSELADTQAVLDDLILNGGVI